MKNHSLDTQEEQCRRYCRHKNWEVVGVYREEGESAKTSDRTQLQRLIKQFNDNPGEVDYLVVADISRFMRDALDHWQTRTQSEHADVGESGLFLQPLTILNPRFVRFNVTFDF